MIVGLLITLGLLLPVLGGLLIGWEWRAVRARKAEAALSEMQRWMMEMGVDAYGHRCFEEGVTVGRHLGRNEMAKRVILMGRVSEVGDSASKQPMGLN